jgi:hypothetical protein
MPRLDTQQPANAPLPQAPATSAAPVNPAPEASAQPATAAPPTAAQSATTMSQSSMATRLARARSLLEAGSITFPPDANAVDVLSTILEAHPNDAAALEMLRECAQRLLLDAERAQADGAYFEARNLLEELLSFDPGNREALELWRLWVGSDR